MREERPKDLWDRLGEALARLPEEVAADRARAPGLVAELLTEPPAAREAMVASFDRFGSVALAKLLLDRSLENGPEGEELANLALGVAGALDAAAKGSVVVEQVKARAWAAMANARRQRGDLAAAESFFHEAACHLAPASDPLEEALFHRLRSRLRRDQGELQAAISLQERAVTLLAGFAHPADTAVALIELAGLHLMRRDAEQVLDALRAAAAVLERGHGPLPGLTASDRL